MGIGVVGPSTLRSYTRQSLKQTASPGRFAFGGYLLIHQLTKLHILEKVKKDASTLKGGNTVGISIMSAEMLNVESEVILHGLHVVLFTMWQLGTILPA